MGNLAGRVALVTGAAQGIGAAIAERLVAEGCQVTITDRLTSVRAVADHLGVTAHVGDVADADHVHAVVDATVGRDGPVTLLVNNAGEVMTSNALSGFDAADTDFDRMFGSNVKGAFLFGRAVAPHMAAAGGGDIVNVSTDHVHPCPGCHPRHGHGHMDLYNAAKWGLSGLTYDWARTLAPHGIRVNNLCMGATDTAMLRGFLGDDPEPGDVASWIRPEQIADVLVDLLGEGPDGRTGDDVGLYAGSPCVLPPPGPAASRIRGSGSERRLSPLGPARGRGRLHGERRSRTSNPSRPA